MDGFQGLIRRAVVRVRLQYVQSPLSFPNSPFFAVELPVFALLYIGWRLIKRTSLHSLQSIDLDTGRYVETVADELDNERIARREGDKRWGWAWRVYSWVA